MWPWAYSPFIQLLEKLVSTYMTTQACNIWHEKYLIFLILLKFARYCSLADTTAAHGKVLDPGALWEARSCISVLLILILKLVHLLSLGIGYSTYDLSSTHLL